MNGSIADLFLSVLSSAAMRLPILIAVAVSVVWVLGSPRSQVRTVALWGLGLMAFASLLGMLANAVPQVLIYQGNFDAMRGIGMLMGFVHFGLNLLMALSVVLVVWAMTRSLRDRTPPAAPPSRT